MSSPPDHGDVEDVQNVSDADVEDVEARFLDMLRAAPEDDGTRLVYADWLEARGDVGRAEFLRTVCKLAAPTVNPKKVPALRERLMRLSTASEARWRALVARPELDGCAIEFRFKCPMKWSALARTDDPAVRHCAACDRDVHFCASVGEIRQHAAERHCVAFDPALRRNEVIVTYHQIAEDLPDDMMDLGEIG